MAGSSVCLLLRGEPWRLHKPSLNYWGQKMGWKRKPRLEKTQDEALFFSFSMLLACNIPFLPSPDYRSETKVCPSLIMYIVFLAASSVELEVQPLDFTSVERLPPPRRPGARAAELWTGGAFPPPHFPGSICSHGACVLPHKRRSDGLSPLRTFILRYALASSRGHPHIQIAGF